MVSICFIQLSIYLVTTFFERILHIEQNNLILIITVILAELVLTILLAFIVMNILRGDFCGLKSILLFD